MQRHGAGRLPCQAERRDANWSAESVTRHACRITVVRHAGHYRLVVSEGLAPGTRICAINGTRATQPTRWTIQVGDRVHIEADPTATLDTQIDRFPWRFLNHSCDPNTRIVRRNVIAVRSIRAGEELTFNYNTTESSLASPFTCHCGSLVCHGVIRGFTHLTPREQERLRPCLPVYLRRLLKRQPGGIRPR